MNYHDNYSCIMDDNSITLMHHKITIEDMIEQSYLMTTITNASISDIYDIIRKHCDTDKDADEKFDNICIILQNYSKRRIPDVNKAQHILTIIYNELQFKIQQERITRNIRNEIEIINTNIKSLQNQLNNNHIRYNYLKEFCNEQIKYQEKNIIFNNKEVLNDMITCHELYCNDFRKELLNERCKINKYLKYIIIITVFSFISLISVIYEKLL
jgi:hypothetical protein